MRQMHLVYDCRQTQTVPGFSYLFLIFVLIGLVVFFYHLFNLGERKVIGMVIGAFAALFGLSLFLTVISSRKAAIAGAEYLYRKGNYKIVEGAVTNYHAASSEDHTPETFDVDNVHFETWEPDLTTQGYNATAESGSVIKPGIYVRIAYAKSYDRYAILRLETAE